MVTSSNKSHDLDYYFAILTIIPYYTILITILYNTTLMQSFMSRKPRLVWVNRDFLKFLEFLEFFIIFQCFLLDK